MPIRIEPIWKELTRLGFVGSIDSLTQLYKWIRTVELLHTPPKLQYEADGTLHAGPVQYKDSTIVMSGSFGILYLIYRETDNESGYAFLKASPTHTKTLLLEGILQSIAYSVLYQYGFPKAVPRVLDIFSHPTYGTVLALEKQPGAKLFSEYLQSHIQWGIPCKSNDTLFLSVLGQIATYLTILETELGMNHRDLTGSNVLMVDPTEPVHQTVVVGSTTWSVHSNQRAILIDFGFACIGTQQGKTIVSAGEYLPNTDFCPKQGRDLFLFFASLWSVALFRSSVTDAVKGLFSKWLRDTTSKTQWASWLTTSCETNLLSMYLLTNAEQFQSTWCRPMDVLRDIASIDATSIVFL